MPVRRNAKTEKWFYRKRVKLPDGSRVDITGTPALNTKLEAERAERAHIQRVLEEFHNPTVKKKEVPTFAEWFMGDSTDPGKPNGRFWIEWVIGRKNKPSSAEEKLGVYHVHLKDAFGRLPLDQIRVGEIARFRAKLVGKLSDKRINNILAVLSKALRYAVDVEIIHAAPKVGLLKIERPEIVPWELDEYSRILKAAREYGPEWYAAVCLAGEAGLRVGEVKALRWKEDVDLIAGTITVNQQIRHGVVGTPKGRTRRSIPMTSTLLAAIKSLSVVRTGYVLRGLDGEPKTDNQVRYALDEIYKGARLAVRGWHALRHTFGTHAAIFGVNPWRLQRWMGHKRIDETMLYVNVAETHTREIPAPIMEAGARETDPDRRILTMLGSRCIHVASENHETKKNEELSAVR